MESKNKIKKGFINIVLVEPEIPPNTGNIGRLCVGLDIPLFLIGELGFSLDDKYLKRAGLDYWKHLTYYHFDNLDFLFKTFKKSNFYFFSKKAEKIYYDAEFKWGDFIVFGKETRGLPENLLKKNKDNSLKIPMVGKTRSYNLSNSVAVTALEAYRQILFK